MFVLRTGVIKKEVHIDNKFISATNFLVYTMGGLKNRPTVRLITWLIVAKGRRVVVASFFYRTSYTKKLRRSFFHHWLIHSKIFSCYANLEVDWLLLVQLVCDTIQSLCEYLMIYSSLTWEIFLKPNRGREGTPYNSLYGEAPPERNALFGLHVYKRVGIY